MLYLHRAIGYKRSIIICRFLRSVSYRQLTHLLWDSLGRSKQYPLPCCAYSAIRDAFPSDGGQCRGFEQEEEEKLKKRANTKTHAWLSHLFITI